MRKILLSLLVACTLSFGSIFSEDGNEVGRYQLHMGSDPMTKGFILDTKTGLIFTILIENNLEKDSYGKSFKPRFTPYLAYTYKGKDYPSPEELKKDFAKELRNILK